MFFPPVHNFRQFFFRGLAILLPSVLTIWILLAAYQFVQHRIAAPINAGVREVVLRATPWPPLDERRFRQGARTLADEVGPDRIGEQRYTEGQTEPAAVLRARELAAIEMSIRRTQLRQWWSDYALVMDLIGLVVAIVLIYMAGLLLGSYIGRRLYQRGEDVFNRLPLVGRVYPAVKQVTDFVVGSDKKQLSFNRVVAVQYPRKGLWSVGLVTGETMDAIQQRVGEECMTVFIPSSPTPFTGYVITVPTADVIDMPITVEDAMKFAVSGGVLIPPNQQIERPETPETAPALPQPAEDASASPPSR